MLLHQSVGPGGLIVGSWFGLKMHVPAVAVDYRGNHINHRLFRIPDMGMSRRSPLRSGVYYNRFVNQESLHTQLVALLSMSPEPSELSVAAISYSSFDFSRLFGTSCGNEQNSKNEY